MSLLESDRKSIRSNNDAMSSASSSQQSLEEEKKHLKKYILLQEKTAKSKRGINSTAKPKLPTKTDDVRALKGSLWEERDPGSPSSGESPRYAANQPKKVDLTSLEYDELSLSVSADHVKSISHEECSLLLAVPSSDERCQIFEDRTWLEEGLLMKDGAQVTVTKRNISGIPGTVKWRGRLHGKQGTWFGVELESACGDTDGTGSGKRYFHCQPGHGVFVNVSSLRLRARSPYMSTDGLPNSNHNVSGYDVPLVNGKPPLKVGDRIVWISDSGPEFGYVRWLDQLDDVPGPDKWMAGVEFDNPVGSGTGKYKGRQLFTCKLNHASLVPVIGLIRAEEYNAPDDDTSLTDDLQLKLTDNYLPELHGTSSNIVNDICTSTPESSTGQPYTSNSHPLEVLRPAAGKPAASEKDRHSASAPLVSSPSLHHRVPKNLQTTDPPPNSSLEIGSLVEVLGNPPKYGIIRWIGTMPESKYGDRPIAGLEMDEPISGGTDGEFMGQRLFRTAPGRGFFLFLDKCRKDSRFTEKSNNDDKEHSQYFGSGDGDDVDGEVSPPCSPKDVKKFFGKKHGIQGHHNSCYLDACLFCMFSFTTVFDHLLHRRSTKEDLPEYSDIQAVLRTSIVNPLRKKQYVRADKVLKLRHLLDKLGLMQGLMGEEKDPEEFLSLLLQKVMRSEPFIKLSNGQESHTLQLTAQKDDKVAFPMVQQLLERTCVQDNIKFSETPSCLILQMPRFGKHYKMYDKIFPNATIDITDLLVEAPRECYTCGALATHECLDCYKETHESLAMSAFCSDDNMRQHQKKTRSQHKYKPVLVQNEYLQQSFSGQPPQALPRVKLDLFAVLCIETSHYVAFVKCGPETDAPWVFFDSMADRKGDAAGYNIPEVMPLNDMNSWLASDLTLGPSDSKPHSPYLKRLLCDGYICFYQSRDVSMYK